MITCIIAEASARSLPGWMREYLVGQPAGAVDDRIDDVKFGSVSPRLDDERPEVDVGAEDVRAPGDNQLGMRGTARAPFRSGRRALSVMPAAPAAEQIVRSSREAPSRWKNRRSIPEPFSMPIVPA